MSFFRACVHSHLILTFRIKGKHDGFRGDLGAAHAASYPMACGNNDLKSAMRVLPESPDVIPDGGLLRRQETLASLKVNGRPMHASGRRSDN
jgi:hypothetical protein